MPQLLWTTELMNKLVTVAFLLYFVQNSMNIALFGKHNDPPFQSSIIIATEQQNLNCILHKYAIQVLAILPFLQNFGHF